MIRSLRRYIACLAITFVCLLSVAQAAERRIALVIGVSAYQNAPPLLNPVRDARAVGEALKRLNFEVYETYDPDYRALALAIRNFGIQAAKADFATVYYAGHGVQVDRENYLLPIDTKLERQQDLFYEGMPLERLLAEVSQAHVGIVLLDSCRNNPFVERIARSMIAGRAVNTTPGLARVDNVPTNTMVIMAARADQIAEDGQAHSPFAAALLAHFQVPGLELSLFYRSVRDTVLKATSNRQEPYFFGSLGAEPVFFYPRPPNHPPVIGQIKQLQVTEVAGPTPLGIPQPTDPDQDPLTVRIIGLPRSGEVRIEGKVVAPNEVYSVEKFMTGTYKPDGHTYGPVGTVDILVEDGRGGSVTGSLPINVTPSHHPPVVEASRKINVYPIALGITAPVSIDGDALNVRVTGIPRNGLVLRGTAEVREGDQMKPQDLATLTFMPQPGFTGESGSLQYTVDNGRGMASESSVIIQTQMPRPQSADNEPAARPNPAPPPIPSPPPVPIKPIVEAPADMVVIGPDQRMLLPPPPSQLAMAAPRVVPTIQPPPGADHQDARAFQDCSTCPLMLRIPGGSFTMGLGSREPEAMPAHHVDIRSFALSQTPITIGEWQSCIAAGDCRLQPRMQVNNDRSPVHNLSWDDTLQYLDWLSHGTGLHYRLPSETEWEYAARAGTTSRYWWGDNVGVALANCTDCGGSQNVHGPLPVDLWKANPYGLLDMLGGVAQWTADCWVANYVGAPSDNAPRDGKSCAKRVLRGGGFRETQAQIAVMSRGNYDQSVRYIQNGFRVARDFK